MMEKVKLNRDNYVAVMSGVKVFVEHTHTQKRGYKLLARVIENYQLSSIDELFQIKTEITPLMKGSASKQRLQLIKSYIDALIRFSEAALVSATEQDKEQLLVKINDLIRSMVIELITAINNSNLKIRNLSGEIFLRISLLLSNYKATAQLL
jgi:uncharacterized phage infection (PIP) family protein YhgE